MSLGSGTGADVTRRLIYLRKQFSNAGISRFTPYQQLVCIVPILLAEAAVGLLLTRCSKPDCQAHGEQFSRVLICFLNRHLGHGHLLIISAYRSRTARASDSAVHQYSWRKIKPCRLSKIQGHSTMRSGTTRQDEAAHSVEAPVGRKILGL